MKNKKFNTEIAPIAEVDTDIQRVNFYPYNTMPFFDATLKSRPKPDLPSIISFKRWNGDPYQNIEGGIRVVDPRKKMEDGVHAVDVILSKIADKFIIITKKSKALRLFTVGGIGIAAKNTIIQGVILGETKKINITPNLQDRIHIDICVTKIDDIIDIILSKQLHTDGNLNDMCGDFLDLKKEILQYILYVFDDFYDYLENL